MAAELHDGAARNAKCSNNASRMLRVKRGDYHHSDSNRAVDRIINSAMRILSQGVLGNEYGRAGPITATMCRVMREMTL
jgi:hypothetical protein